jgi:ATP-dependent Lon protease
MNDINDLELGELKLLLNDLERKINKYTITSLTMEELDDMSKLMNEISKCIKNKNGQKKCSNAENEKIILMYNKMSNIEKCRFRIMNNDLYRNVIMKNNSENSRDNNITTTDNRNTTHASDDIVIPYDKMTYDKITYDERLISTCRETLNRLYRDRVDYRRNTQHNSERKYQELIPMKPILVDMDRSRKIGDRMRREIYSNVKEQNDKNSYEELRPIMIEMTSKDIKEVKIEGESDSEEIKEQKKFTDYYDSDEFIYYMNLDCNVRDDVEAMENKIKLLNKTTTPLRFKVLFLDIPLENKSVIIGKLNEFKTPRGMIGGDCMKYMNWLNSLLRIPFGKYIDLKVTNKDKPEVIINFLNNGKKILDDAIYGHDETKNCILEVMARWIKNPQSENNILALHGNPGTGKTDIIKRGLSKIYGRPFVFISLGGINNVSYFNGHSITYEGSTYGKLAEILMDTKCMNPIIYFDELDKIGNTPHGEEISNLLIHLTDTAQNSHFNDKYFSSIPIDLSKCLFVFSFNHIERINPILLDRLQVIDVDDYNMEDKLNIARGYLLPNIYEQYNLTADNITFNEEIIKYIIEKYTERSGGVRSLKQSLNKIVSKINYLIYSQKTELFDNFEKIVLTQDIVDNLLKEKKYDDIYNVLYI